MTLSLEAQNSAAKAAYLPSATCSPPRSVGPAAEALGKRRRRRSQAAARKKGRRRKKEREGERHISERQREEKKKRKREREKGEGREGHLRETEIPSC